MHNKIFAEISNQLIANIMRHEQFSDVMDFLGLRGFKREGEYHYFKESAELRGLHRYSINHFNKIIFDKDVPNPKLIPSSWEGATRQQVDDSIRKKYVKQMFLDWKDWECQAREKYQRWYKQLIDDGHIDAGCKVLSLLKDNESEIKCLERQIIEYEAVNWDMPYIMFKQDEIHEYYREKEKRIGIDIC